MDMENDDVWVTAPFSRRNVLHKTLQELDATLRCEICGDLYCNPVSLNTCQHTFCSQCIRDSLTEQSGRVRQGGPTCPSCRTPLDGRRHESNYRPNRSLEKTIAVFRRLREPLHDVLVQVATNGVPAASTAPAGAVAATVPTGDSSGYTENDNDTSPSNDSSRPRRGAKRPAEDEEDARSTTNTSTAGATTAAATQLPEKRRKIYNHYKKRKDLETLCRQEGISAHGTDQELKKRHERFVNYWNAHRDNLNGCAKTAAQIVQEFNAQETARNRTAAKEYTTRAALDDLYQERAGKGTNGNSSSSTGIGSMAASALKAEIKSNFKELIEKARRLKNQKKAGGGSASDSSGNESSSASVDASPEQNRQSSNDPASEADDTANEGVQSKQPSSPNGENSTGAGTSSPDQTYERLQQTLSRSSSSTPEGSVMFNKEPRSIIEARKEVMDSDAVVLVDDVVQPPAANKRAKRPNHQVKPRQVSSGASLVGPWQCPRCTFVNHKHTWSRASCEMCNLVRPKPSAART